MKQPNRALFAVVALGLLIAAWPAAAQLPPPEAAELTATPPGKLTPDPLMTAAPISPEPSVLIPAFAPSRGRLIAAAILIVTGAALIFTIILRHQGGE